MRVMFFSVSFNTLTMRSVADPDIRLREGIMLSDPEIRLGERNLPYFSVSLIYFFVGGEKSIVKLDRKPWPDLFPLDLPPDDGIPELRIN